MVTFSRRLPRTEFLSPKTMDEVFLFLSQYRSGERVVAGDTDLLPTLKRKEVKIPHYFSDLI